MKKLLSVLLLTLSASSPAHAIWPGEDVQRRQNASTCPELIQAAGYYMSKYHQTGNGQFKNLMNQSLAKAQSKGCR